MASTLQPWGLAMGWAFWNVPGIHRLVPLFQPLLHDDHVRGDSSAAGQAAPCPSLALVLLQGPHLEPASAA